MIDHASVFNSLKPDEIKILRSIENGMKTHEWVSVENMASYSGLSTKEIEYRLRHIIELDLIERYTATYVGYQLKYNGYDILAISAFVKKGTIHSLGGLIGVGKESVVIAAMGLKPVAIKFHREGRTAFKQVKRKREHLLHVEADSFSWLYASLLAAKREFEVMQQIYPAVSVPEPIDQNRHAIVMSVVEGYDLSRVNVTDPDWYLDRILEQVKNAYDLGYIHGDLSEYNVIVREDGITVIDWPQAVTADSRLADELLTRDVSNILVYFERKYRVKRDLNATIAQIKSDVKSKGSDEQY